MKNLINSPYFLWLLLVSPLAVMTSRYVTSDIFYGEYIHFTGEFSARLLIVTMALTPLRLMFRAKYWPDWLYQRRRYFGVATFGYAIAHLIVYLLKSGLFEKIIDDSLEPGILTGWLAFLLFVPLAITSNNYSVRRLRDRWKTLHRLVYLAALFTFLHWILVAYNPVPGYIHAGILVSLEIYRMWKVKKESQFST